MSDVDANEYETHDIYLAAYFKVAGCKMLRKRKVGPRVYFVFTNTAGSMEEMRDSYFKGESKVAAHNYAQEIIACKQMCFP